MAATAPTTPNYEVNYEDERFKQSEANKQAALTESNQMYDQMIGQSESFFNNQIEASKRWAEQQQQLQQEQTDFAIEQMEQQKEQIQKDYIKEQSGAYVDWQKQSNQYGANAEQMAASGMSNTGYSESSQVSMYNTYQNKIATARQVASEAHMKVENALNEAMLENNVLKAEIAMQAYQEQLQLAFQGFQYKNDLLLQQATGAQQIEARYQAQWQAILDQINQENALAEEVRQYNANLLEEQRQYNENLEFQKTQAKQEQENWQKEYDLMLAQLEAEAKEAAAAQNTIKSDSSNSTTAKSSYSPTSTVKDAVEAGKNTGSSSYNPLKDQLGASSKSGLSVGDVAPNNSGMSNAQVFSTFTGKEGTSGGGAAYGALAGQAKGIVGYGRVTASFTNGKRDVFEDGKSSYFIWTTSDGSMWYWDKSKNNYVYLGK